MTSRRLIALKGFKLLDLLIVFVAFVVAAWVEIFHYRAGSLSEVLSIRLRLVNVVILFSIFMAWRFVFRRVGLYRSRRLSSVPAELFDAIKATSLSALMLFNVAVVLDLEIISNRFVVVFWILSTLGVVSTRLLLRATLRRARLSGKNLSRILIAGTNARALSFADRLRSMPHLGYEILGFADEEWSGLNDLHRSEFKLVCSLDDLPQYLRENVVDEVIIALPMSSAYQRSAEIVRLCESQGILVRLLTDLFNLNLARAEVTDFNGQAVISLQSGAMRGDMILVKRVIDFAVALACLVVSLPVFVVVAAGIKLTSPGSVFFIQERIGLAKRRFKLIKFRTMVEGADQRQAALEHLNEASGPVFKIEEDPRITPMGRFLRRTSLDELPQLINVLLGHMSLVGPRPLPIRDYDGFGEDWHRRRFSVRPGITCLWQVMGRSSLPFDRWMELDMQYIDQWSLGLDLRILLKTIPAVVKGQGAA